MEKITYTSSIQCEDKLAKMDKISKLRIAKSMIEDQTTKENKALFSDDALTCFETRDFNLTKREAAF